VRKVGVHEAKTHLSRLLREVETGEEVVIVRNGDAVARLVRAEPRRREFGMDEGRFTVPDDFNDPLPDELQRAFDGG
jgi:prevent-host-death family protein